MVDISGNVNPTFHVVFREDDGTPLIGGSVYWYKASDHSTLKAVYEDRARTILLPNPTPLNAAGIVSDNTGAPKPVYLSDDENYYVAVYRAGESPPIDIPIQTVDNWNADNAFSTKPQFDEIVTTNYIPNSQFRTLVHGKTEYTSSDLNATNNVLIARDNWYLRRDVLTSTNTIDFKEFVVGQTLVPFNPKYYLNFSCSVISTETVKDITVDIGDAETFANQEMTLAIYAKSSTLSQIEILADQDFGSGGSSQVLTVVDSFQLTTSFAQYSTTFTTANVSGKTIGTDNRFRIRARVPLNQICNIDFVMCQLNFGDTILEFDFQPSIMNDGNASKDAIPQPSSTDAFKVLSIASDNVTNKWLSYPPVGVVDWIATDVVPPGYLKSNGGSYSGIQGSPYANLSIVLLDKWGDGSNGFRASDGGTKYISIAVNEPDTNVPDIIDGNTGFTFETAQQGGNKGFSVVDKAPLILRVTNKNNGNVTDAAAGTSGFTTTIIQQGTVSVPEITDVTVTSAAGLAGKYFLISSTTTDYYVWFTEDGSGADPAVGGRTGIKVPLISTMGTPDVKTFVYYALRGCELQLVTCNAASTLAAGDYFLIHNAAVTYVCWYKINGVGIAPSVSGTKVQIDVLSSDTDLLVASKTRPILSRILFKTPDIPGYVIRAWDHGAGRDPDAATRLGQKIGVSGDKIGTVQEDEYKSHRHGIGQYEPQDGATTSCVSNINIGSNHTAYDGGSETRGKNIYMMPIIKY